MSGFAIRVGGLHTIPADIPQFRPTHLLGILDPLMPEPAIYRHKPESRVSLLLRFLDIEAGEPEGPETDHVEAIIGFVDRVCAESRRSPARLLIHCHAGVSRSTASAYLARARDLGLDRAVEAFQDLLRIAVNPWPNRRLVQLADEALSAGGRLLAPLDAYRRANLPRFDEMMAYHQARVGQGLEDDSDPFDPA